MTNLPIEVDEYLNANDFSQHTAKAVKCDLAKFIRWFESANEERFDFQRVTVRDVADFREHLARGRRQAVSTVNRALVSIRRLLGHLARSGDLPGNRPKTTVNRLEQVNNLLGVFFRHSSSPNQNATDDA